MPNFNLGLAQNLPNREPSRFQVVYEYSNGGTQSWWFENVQPDRDVAIVSGDAAGDLVNQQGVRSRMLRAHYSTEPYTVDTQILTVILNRRISAVLATNYGIAIDMSDETVTALSNGGFYLYAFKGVQTTMKGGAPTVWFKTNTYSVSTDISWAEQYQAYSSKSVLVPNGQIKASAAYNVDLGQTFNINSEKGTGEVVQGGVDGAISIRNNTQTQFTSGISQVVDGKASPLCAFPQYGNNLNVMAPIQKVLLMFSTQPVNTGTVIYQAYSAGGLFDLTGVTERQVSYDINKGWDWGGGAWGKQIAAQASLVPLLIESSASLEERTMAAFTSS